MNIEPDAVETYQFTLTLLLAFKLAERRYPKRKTTMKNRAWNLGRVDRIAECVKYTAGQLAKQTNDPTLYDTLHKITIEQENYKVMDALTLTFNTMKRDGLI